MVTKSVKRVLASLIILLFMLAQAAAGKAEDLNSRAIPATSLQIMVNSQQSLRQIGSDKDIKPVTSKFIRQLDKRWCNKLEYPKILSLADGGFMVLGTIKLTLDTLSPSSILVMKLDQNGNDQWEKILGTNQENARAINISILDDGGYLIYGSMERVPYNGSNRENVLLKISATGQEEWRKFQSDPDYKESLPRKDQSPWPQFFNKRNDIIPDPMAYTVNSIYKATTDGGCIACELVEENSFINQIMLDQHPDLSKNSPYTDIVLKKYNQEEKMDWGKTILVEDLSGSELVLDNIGLKTTADGGCLICTGSKHYICLIKRDKKGDMEWYKSIHNTGLDGIRLLTPVNDEVFAAIGPGDAKDPNRFSFLKVDKQGKVYCHELNLNGITLNGADPFELASDGGFFVLGQDKNDALYLIKLDDQGRVGPMAGSPTQKDPPVFPSYPCSSS
ncbi:MAG TPA: hypothetical protein VN426_11590 [Syntrophomonadaceae bacterium]|nr:hypothetical protein [Syntrophomonadaceae bacterium]